MNTKIITIVVLAASVALLLAACGSSQPSTPVAPTPAPAYNFGPGMGMMGNGGMGVPGGMMGGGHMGVPGGMMGDYGYGQYAPTAEPTPAGATPAPVDQEIPITAINLRFSPDEITVKPGATVRFTLTNGDPVVHNFVSQEAGIPYLPLPANTTQTLTWTAPNAEGTYAALCTLHPGMTFVIDVEK